MIGYDSRMKNHKVPIIIIAAVIIIALVGAYIKGWNPLTGPAEWKTYIEEDFDFQVSYPEDWNMSDELAPGSCCLFISSWSKKTTFEPNASGTPVEKVTATENVKLQIGNYDRKAYDPFGSASTTKIALGNTEFYKGIAENGMEFYLLPRSETEGVGAAIFAYTTTTEEHKKTVREIIATIKLLPVTATSTASSTPNSK